MDGRRIDTNPSGGAPFFTRTETQPMPSLSPLEQLQQTIEAHVTAEEESLGGYRELAEKDPDPIVRVL